MDEDVNFAATLLEKTANAAEAAHPPSASESAVIQRSGNLVSTPVQALAHQFFRVAHSQPPSDAETSDATVARSVARTRAAGSRPTPGAPSEAPAEAPESLPPSGPPAEAPLEPSELTDVPLEEPGAPFEEGGLPTPGTTETDIQLVATVAEAQAERLGRITGFVRDRPGEVVLQPPMEYSRAVMWLSKHRRAVVIEGFLDPTAALTSEAFASALRNIEEEVAGLLRLVHFDANDDPTAAGPGAVRSAVLLSRVPWEPTGPGGSEDAANIFWLPVPDKKLMEKRKGAVKGLLKRTFGSDFFARTLLSLGHTNITEAVLDLFDKLLVEKHETQESLGATGAAYAACGAERRALKPKLDKLRKEMVRRWFLPPIQHEVDVRGDRWCVHGWEQQQQGPTSGLLCRRCPVLNCHDC
ncbi:MAG: hypothetical protein GY772_28720, partial [bacterium]|nr:hypothetical protein [bacterium]